MNHIGYVHSTRTLQGTKHGYKLLCTTRWAQINGDINGYQYKEHNHWGSCRMGDRAKSDRSSRRDVVVPTSFNLRQVRRPSYI